MGDGVTRVSFCCPACERVYLISYTDKQKEQQKKEISKLLSVKRNKKDEEKLDKLRRELRGHENWLKDKYA